MKHLAVILVLLQLLVESTLAETTRPTISSHEFALVREGRPQATIVLDRQPSCAARFAANELRDHVKRITGTELPIATDAVETPGPRILVGPSAATKAMGLGSDDLASEEYMIQLRPSTLVLLGKDDSNSQQGDWTSSPPPQLFGSNGTLYAVYHFLERFCNVRWYAPGEIGLVCPQTRTLVVQGEDVRRSPAMVYRWITPTPLYMPAPPQQIPPSDVHVWKLRMRIGGQAFWVCHSFEGYYDRFLKEHPDWFAQGYKGKPPQMCYTNPDFIKQVVADARAYFDGMSLVPGATAMGDVYGLVPMDNMNWCKCPQCQAEINAVERANQQFNNGKASDYIFGFVNRVAREVHKTHPSKWIGALAYSDYAYYPTKFPVEPNVVVQLCLHTRNWWCPSMEVNDRRMLNEWRTRDPQRPLYLWLYYNFPALNAKSGNYRYFPGFFAHSVVTQMDLYHQAHIRGVFMEHSSEFGATYLMDQLEFYVTLKLADDPTLDGRQLIEEFFAKYYGAAGPAMRELYNTIEQAFFDSRMYPLDIQQSKAHQHQNERLAWETLGTEARMNRITTLMTEALQAECAPLEKQRVEMFAAGVVDYMREGRRLFLRRTQPSSKHSP